MKVVIDTFAWIEYLKGSARGIEVKNILESDENEAYTSVISIAEISSRLKRENEDFELAYSEILKLSKVYSISNELAKESGMLHAETRKSIKDFGMVDSIILATARKLGAKVVTGDPHFKGFKEAILI